MSGGQPRPGEAAGDDRAELIRALGAIAVTPPPGSDALTAAVGLPAMSGVDHTTVFVLAAPPFASVHLGAEGGLGGEALDRVEGFWRALRQPPPPQADHLGVLLMSYAHLVEAGRSVPAAQRAASVLLHEHIRSFAPGYLTAVTLLGVESTTAWAELTLEAIDAEPADPDAVERLPLALHDAPAALTAQCGLDELLDAMVAPVRCGLVLTQRELAEGAAAVGVGYRRGERRFALKAMVEQDKSATLGWLGELALAWSARHRDAYGDDETGRWWVARADAIARLLSGLSEEVA